MIRRVIKVGGSLLDMQDVAVRLTAWLSAQPAGQNLLLAGGGRLVDCLCVLDRLHQLDAAAMHWLAIDAMSITAKLLSELIAAPLVGDVHCSDLWANDALAVASTRVLDVAACLRTSPDLRTRFAADLPQSWQTTSDSIAAFLATHGRADELVLLKSSLPTSGMDLRALASCGSVDEHFPRAAAELPAVRLVDLRTAGWPEIRHSPAVNASSRAATSGSVGSGGLQF